MNRELGKEFEGLARLNFLKDNADGVEEKGYMKQFSDAEILEMKTELSEVDIEMNDIDEEKKAIAEAFNLRVKPLKARRKCVLSNIKQKHEFVKEQCFKFIDFESRTVGYYNAEGDLIESRPAYAEELQKTIFQDMRKTGTNDKN